MGSDIEDETPASQGSVFEHHLQGLVAAARNLDAAKQPKTRIDKWAAALCKIKDSVAAVEPHSTATESDVNAPRKPRSASSAQDITAISNNLIEAHRTDSTLSTHDLHAAAVKSHSALLKAGNALDMRRTAISRALCGMPYDTIENWAVLFAVDDESHASLRNTLATLTQLIQEADTVKRSVSREVAVLESRNRVERDLYIHTVLEKIEALYMVQDAIDIRTMRRVKNYQQEAFRAINPALFNSHTEDSPRDIFKSKSYATWRDQHRADALCRERFYAVFVAFGPVVVVDSYWNISDFTKDGRNGCHELTSHCIAALDPRHDGIADPDAAFESVSNLLRALTPDDGIEYINAFTSRFRKTFAPLVRGENASA